MLEYDESIHFSEASETGKTAEESINDKTFLNYFSIAFTTCGVGYLPLAPGTWGSMVGVSVYLIFRLIETNVSGKLSIQSWTETQITAFIHAFNLIIFLIFSLLGIWASNRVVILLQTKDPQKIVVDEIIGQLIVFLFVPFDISWKFILTGFVLFRLFDMWKPYPIKYLENLPSGLGVCADDILAGIYGGICLSLIYAISLTI